MKFQDLNNWLAEAERAGCRVTATNTVPPLRQAPDRSFYAYSNDRVFGWFIQPHDAPAEWGGHGELFT